MDLRKYLENGGYKLIEPSYYALVGRWNAWYKGKVSSFHNYTIRSGTSNIRRTRASLNMAKQGCEYWANLLWNKECSVVVEDQSLNDVVNATLKDNDFWRQTNQLTERAFALGAGAYIAYASGGQTRIDYVTADYIYPLAWRNDDIESCAFAGSYNQGKKRLVYLMIHEMQPDGSYRIYNKYFEKSGGRLVEVSAPDDVEAEYTAKARRFGLIKPGIANNIASVPFGLSIYANCIDVLKSIDLAYDGAKTAMELGRPRIGVTNAMLRVKPDSAEVVDVFDANDIAVYDMGFGGAGDNVDVKDLTTQYRATEFELSLQAQLNIYSQAIGLGDKAFKWQQTSVATATQVISENSAMLRAMEKHQESLRTSITQLVRAILDINGIDVSQEVTVTFDDSITRDRAREAQEAWQWVVAGKYPFWKYLVDFKGYDKKTALAIAAEAQTSLPKDPDDAGEE